MYDLSLYTQIAWTSLANSSYQVLFAVAFALVLKVMRIWNFAQPAMMAVSFYAMYAVIEMLRMPPFLAMGFALILSIGFVYILERWAFVTLRNRRSGPMAFFIFTIVVSQFVIYVLTLVFTAEPRFLLGNMTWSTHEVFGVFVTNWDLIAIAVTLVLVGALYV